MDSSNNYGFGRSEERIGARHGIAQAAGIAAILDAADARVTSTIVGVSKPEPVWQALDRAVAPIPPEAWDELMALPYDLTDPEAGRDYRPGWIG